MGLGSWLAGIGIRFEQGAQYMGTRRGTVPLQWPAGLGGSLIYRLPRDPTQRASIFSTVQTIVVNEGEAAVVIEDGKSLGALEPGRYVFEKARVVGSLDVIWLRMGQQAIKWGVGNVTSFDGIQLSGNGTLYARILEPNVFNAEVVQGAVTLSEVDLQRFVMPRLQGVLRTTFASFEALALQTQRDVFTDAIKNALGKTFESLGLAIVDVEVVEINFPPEFKAVLAQATMAQHGGKAQLIEAHTRAQVTQLEAAAAAQAQLMTGTAHVQVMAQLQAAGIDPLKLKALEALQTMAENPTQGAVLGGDAAARVALFGQVAGAALAQPSPIPGPVAALPPALTPAQPVVESSVTTASETPEGLERQIDALVERLAEGKISEDTYNKLVARLESKLQKLRGQ